MLTEKTRAKLLPKRSGVTCGSWKSALKKSMGNRLVRNATRAYSPRNFSEKARTPRKFPLSDQRAAIISGFWCCRAPQTEADVTTKAAEKEQCSQSTYPRARGSKQYRFMDDAGIKGAIREIAAQYRMLCHDRVDDLARCGFLKPPQEELCQIGTDDRQPENRILPKEFSGFAP